MFVRSLVRWLVIQSALTWALALVMVPSTAAAAAPTVRPSSVSATTVTLSWTAVSGVDGYVVIRSLTGFNSADAVTVNAGNTTTFKSDGLKPGTLYHFAVRPYVKETPLPDSMGLVDAKTLLTDAAPTQPTPTQPTQPVATPIAPGPKRALNPGVAPTVVPTVLGVSCPAGYTLKTLNSKLTCELKRTNGTALAAYARSCSQGQSLMVVAGTDYCVVDGRDTRVNVMSCPADYVDTVEYSETTDACVYYGVDYRIPVAN